MKAERETAQQLEAARKEARQQEERLRSQYGAEASGLRRELQEAERCLASSTSASFQKVFCLLSHERIFEQFRGAVSTM